jgi:hypothetical protein
MNSPAAQKRDMDNGHEMPQAAGNQIFIRLWRMKQWQAIGSGTGRTGKGV